MTWLWWQERARGYVRPVEGSHSWVQGRQPRVLTQALREGSMAHTSQVHQHFLSSSGCLVWVLGNRVVQSRWLVRSDWLEPALQ